MEASTREAMLGTVIHGTLQPEDLLRATIEVLEKLDAGRASKIRKQYPDVFEIFLKSDEERSPVPMGRDVLHILEEASWCFEEICNELNAIAPEGTFFGAHPGDGSDFGFWPVESEDIEDVHTPTGRTSCSSQNYQNVPVRSCTGDNADQTFLASSAPSTADYSRAEMRIAEAMRRAQDKKGN